MQTQRGIFQPQGRGRNWYLALVHDVQSGYSTVEGQPQETLQREFKYKLKIKICPLEREGEVVRLCDIIRELPARLEIVRQHLIGSNIDVSPPLVYPIRLVLLTCMAQRGSHPSTRVQIIQDPQNITRLYDTLR